MKQFRWWMTERPERRQVYGSVSYAFLGFALLPLLLMFLNLGFVLKAQEGLWVELTFHGINFVALMIIFFPYLRESFENMRLFPKTFFKTTAIGTLAMLVVTAILFYAGVLFGNDLLSVGVLPITEIEFLRISGNIVWDAPVLGTVAMVVMAPFTISCLFYATSFATICNDRPLLAYGITALMLAVPRIINALTFWAWDEQLTLYLVQLPIHLIACRMYQRTDTVWSPITALIVSNSVACVLIHFL